MSSPATATDPAAVLARAGIEPTRRAEELGSEDWLRLAEVAE